MLCQQLKPVGSHNKQILYNRGEEECTRLMNTFINYYKFSHSGFQCSCKMMNLLSLVDVWLMEIEFEWNSLIEIHCISFKILVPLHEEQVKPLTLNLGLNTGQICASDEGNNAQANENEASFMMKTPTQVYNEWHVHAKCQTPYSWLAIWVMVMKLYGIH